MKNFLLIILISLLSINISNAWLGLIAENGDLLNITKWNQLVSEKLSRVDLEAGNNISLTNSGSIIYINGVNSGNEVPFISNTSVITFTTNEIKSITLNGRNFIPGTIVSTSAGTVSNLNIVSPGELTFDLTVGSSIGNFDIILSNDGFLNTSWTNNGVGLIAVFNYYYSCKEIYDAGYSIGDGNYTLLNTTGTYQVYCDMSTDSGGWTRVVRTNGNNQEWGQKNDNYTYAINTADLGIYDAYRYINSFSKIMLKHTNSSTFASYNLVSASTDTIYDLMTFCKGQAASVQNDTIWDGARLKGMTSTYSGLKVAGTMVNVNYFFMCGVNEDSDNDQSYLTFTRSTGQVGNGYGDSWRGTNQINTTWSLLNGDYYTASNLHIGNGYSQASAGRKADGIAGYYEVYIK